MHCPYIDARKVDVGDLDKVDSRSALAIARTNWLHNRYSQIVSYLNESSMPTSPKRKILKKNEDYIYTIYLFLSETTVSDFCMLSRYLCLI